MITLDGDVIPPRLSVRILRRIDRYFAGRLKMWMIRINEIARTDM